MRYKDQLSSIETIIAEAKLGHSFILVDDEDRENEGDLIVAAEFASKEAINFMIKKARGLVCLALTEERAAKMGLNMMTKHNNAPLSTAFTVSVDAKEQVTTGISAGDRAHTIAVLIDESKTMDDLVVPGHMFPLVAKKGGVLERAGHTEAAVDIARLAGLKPAAVICEIINEDGDMARMDDLIEFARLHNIKISTVTALIEYQSRQG